MKKKKAKKSAGPQPPVSPALQAAEQAVEKAGLLAQKRDWTRLMRLAHGLVERAPEHARRVVVVAWEQLHQCSFADQEIFGPELLRAELWACERMGLVRDARAAERQLDQLLGKKATPRTSGR